VNGPAWLLVGWVAAVVAAYLVAALRARRAAAPLRPRVALAVDAGATALGAAAILLVVTTARADEDQPLLGTAVALVSVLLLSATAERWRRTRPAGRDA
jgi:hypothetical protein